MTKAEGFGVPNQLGNIGMFEWLASLETDPDNAKRSDVVHPLFYVGYGWVRDGVVVLVAVMAIQVALLRYVKVRDPRFAVENPKDLLETDHSSLIAVADAASSIQAWA